MNHSVFATAANKPGSTIQHTTAPRYLAGAGDPRQVTDVLSAAGWRNHSVPGFPHVLLASPDHAVELALEPSPDPHSAWWRFDAHGWYASFGSHTPAEIIAAFTDALILPAPQAPPSVQDIRGALTDNTRWSRDYDHRGDESALSPDGYVRMGTRPDIGDDPSQPEWYAEAALTGGAGGIDRVWSARFSYRTPAHLVGAFAAALVSAEPVYRGFYEVPHTWLVTQEPTTMQGEQLNQAHRLRLDQVRATARKLRRAANKVAATPPNPAGPPSPRPQR